MLKNTLSAEDYARQIATTMKESVLQARVAMAVRLAMAEGYWDILYYHTHDSRRSNAGFPDCVFAMRGPAGRTRLVFAELKSAKGRLRPEQREWLGRLALAGEEVYLWRPADLLSGEIHAILCAQDVAILPGRQWVASRPFPGEVIDRSTRVTTRYPG